MRTLILAVFSSCLLHHTWLGADATSLPLALSHHLNLAGKSLVFAASGSAVSYLKFLPESFEDLQALTLCMRWASEDKREFSLFSYATTHNANELSLWYKPDGDGNGVFSVLFSDRSYQFIVPQMTSVLQHYCLTWESETGSLNLWLNGDKSLQKVGNGGHSVLAGGTMMVGEDQDSLGGGFDSSQRFTGEMTEVNLWNRVLPSNAIRALSRGCYSPGGNIVDWNSVRYQVEDDSSIMIIKNNPDCVI